MNFMELLKLPRAAKLDVMFTLGYPAEDRIRNKHRKELDEMRRFVD